MPKFCIDNDIRLRLFLPFATLGVANCGESATPVGGVSAALLQVVLFWKHGGTRFSRLTLKNANQHGRASIQTIKRCLEHFARLIPRVSDRAALVESRIEVSGDYNSGAIYPESRRDLASLIRIHYDDEIRAVHGRWRERPRAKSRQVEAALRADRNRDIRSCAIGTDEPGRYHLGVGERTLKHRLQVRAPTYVAVTYDEYSSWRPGTRQPPTYGVMAAAVEETIGKISNRVICSLYELARTGSRLRGRGHNTATAPCNSGRSPSSHWANPAKKD